jgi:hypothetical protein
MKLKIPLYAAGVINLLIAVFHLFFWYLFNWNEELPRLGATNQTIVQLLNLAVAYTAVLFAYVSLRHPRDLLDSRLGHAMLFLMGLFYILRAVVGVILEGLHNAPDVIIFLIGLGVAALYWIPMWRSPKIETDVSGKTA